MIVEFTYNYWGDNGNYFERRLEEYDSVAAAVDDIGYIAYVNAIDEKVTILRVLDGPIEFKQQIEEGVALYVTQAQRRERIRKLKEGIKHNQRYLDNVDAEIKKRSASIIKDKQELEELEKQQ